MIRDCKEGCFLFIKLTPKSSLSRIEGKEEEYLKVRVKAPPDKGRANEALLHLLSQSLHIAVSHITLVKGQTSRYKQVLILGYKAEEIERALQNYLDQSST